jgi:hypothetical protein
MCRNKMLNLVSNVDINGSQTVAAYVRERESNSEISLSAVLREREHPVGHCAMTSAVAAVGEGNAPVRPVRGVGERHDAADFVPPRVRVALGIDGTYWNSPFAWNAPACKGFKDMRKGALLEALAASRRFAVTLKDVALNQCTVTIMSAVAGEEPTVDEEKDGVQLRLGNTVGMLAKNCPRLFIRVRLPEAQAQGVYIRCVRLRPSTCAWSNSAPRTRGVLPTRMHVH